jgi:ADP-L-glycero-D-manno-heptose 6-epimerase
MRALVTGGTGFVGSNIVKHLISEDHDVIITGFDGEQKIKGFEGKCLHPSFIGIDWEAIGKVDVVFHEAAINNTVLMDEAEMMRANVESTKELFTRCYEMGCRRFVFATSTAIYGDAPAPYKEDCSLNPLNPYAVSKIKMEEWIRSFLVDHPDAIAVGLRYCNVYGPGENHKGSRASMIYQLAQQMIKKQPRIFKMGEQKRDYIYVKDVVKANMLASVAKESCVVNCGSGSATTFNDVITILNGVLSTNWEPEYFDNPYVGRYQDHTECDMSLAQEKIGFVPAYDIRKGIQDFFDSGELTK